MPTSDGNGNYIMSRATFWATVVGIIIVLGGAVFAWGCAFSDVRAELRHDKRDIGEIKADLEETKALSRETSTNVKIIARELDISLD